MADFDLHTTDVPIGLSVIEASAGTGKTWTIAHLLPRLLVDGAVSGIGDVLCWSRLPRTRPANWASRPAASWRPWSGMPTRAPNPPRTRRAFNCCWTALTPSPPLSEDGRAASASGAG